MPADHIPDDEVEAIHDHAVHAAIGRSPYQSAPNPYPPESQRADIWRHAYRNAIANENH